MKALHNIGAGGTPTFTAGSGAGTTPTISVSGTDAGGTVTVTTGTTPAASAVVATINFTFAYGSAPRIILTPSNDAAAALTGAAQGRVVQANVTTAGFPISVVTALTAATTYTWNYWVIQ